MLGAIFSSGFEVMANRFQWCNWGRIGISWNLTSLWGSCRHWNIEIWFIVGGCEFASGLSPGGALEISKFDVFGLEPK